jgi:hypothetical protein
MTETKHEIYTDLEKIPNPNVQCAENYYSFNPIESIIAMCIKHPNDAELGMKVRKLIKTLK